MRTVPTKEELAKALKAKEKVRVTGPLADSFIKKQKSKKNTKIAAAAVAVGGLLAMPFTGGLSGLATMTALTVGTVTISAAEIAVILGGTAAIYGIHKGYKVKYNPDGSVEVEPK